MSEKSLRNKGYEVLDGKANAEQAEMQKQKRLDRVRGMEISDSYYTMMENMESDDSDGGYLERNNVRDRN